MFWVAIGVGLGIGIVHTAVLLTVIVLARSNAKKQETETLDLMRERNEIDAQKVAAINRIADIADLITTAS